VGVAALSLPIDAIILICMTKISICIPTYNRAEFLSRTIKSVLQQDDQVQIVVSDNGSLDGTERIMKELSDRYPQIKYKRYGENAGADRNYLRSIDLADGEFCWFLGSDDVLMPGAIQRVRHAFDSGCEVVLSNRADYDANRSFLGVTNWVDTSEKSHWDTALPRELYSYLSRVRGLGGVFSYLSTIAFKKRLWTAVRYDEQFTGTAYSHAYVLMWMLRNGCRLTFLAEPVVYCLRGNDSFLANGEIRRFLLDFDGYHLISEKVLEGDSSLQNALFAIIRREQPLQRVLRMRRLCSTPLDWARIVRELEYFRYSPQAIAFAGWAGQYPRLVDAAWRINRILKGWRSRMHGRAPVADVTIAQRNM
jgi:abequosyltransferase